MNQDNFSPKTEKTGQRNIEYSLWHRSLGAGCFAVDVDFVEFRDGRGIVAFIAVTGNCVDERHIINSKKFIWARTGLERKILCLLSQKFCVPSYFVIHDSGLNIFHVHRLPDIINFKAMNKSQYADFIKGL